MGKVADMLPRKKKKKGRPSLLDLQKRSLKLQQPNPNSLNPHSISNRPTLRKPNQGGVLPAPQFSNGDEDDDDERKEKKHKLLLGLNSHSRHGPKFSANSLSLNSVSNGYDLSADGEDPETTLKGREINAVHRGSNETGEKVTKSMDTLHGPQVESGPTTPLPDKKLLVFILDRLQKKDTHGIFSIPVDPEELPDYHGIIEHSMDFGTVRKKLDGRAYANLEQFEEDIFLICSNAMRYNAPETIYFRQARSIQELAKKDFENLRQDSEDSEPQPKVVRRGRPPKNLKKSLGGSPFEGIGPEFSSDTTLATGGDNGIWSSTYNLRKGPTFRKFQPADALVGVSHSSRNSETDHGWLSEWENEFPASVLRNVSKGGKKQFASDENRRDTYNHPWASGHESSVLTTLGGELKQLTAVGVHLEHGYARSLARFAADLGPVVWKIASKKIESVLPGGLMFGRGWIGENDASQWWQISFSKELSNDSLSDNQPSRLLSPSISPGLNSIVANRSLPSREDVVETFKELNSQTKSTLPNSDIGNTKPGPPYQIQQNPVIYHDLNGHSGGFGLNSSPQMGLVRLSTSTGTSSSNEASAPTQMLGMVSRSHGTFVHPVPSNRFCPIEPKFLESSSRLHFSNSFVLNSGPESQTTSQVGFSGKSSWQGLPVHHRPDSFLLPSELNVRFQAPDSPSHNVQIGSPKHPDLALQL